eukprot:280432-Prorocentrum_minimum.AAC.1
MAEAMTATDDAAVCGDPRARLLAAVRMFANVVAGLGRRLPPRPPATEEPSDPAERLIEGLRVCTEFVADLAPADLPELAPPDDGETGETGETDGKEGVGRGSGGGQDGKEAPALRKMRLRTALRTSSSIRREAIVK